jgi:hypothetical protein
VKTSTVLQIRDAVCELLRAWEPLDSYDVHAVLTAEVSQQTATDRPQCFVGPAGMSLVRLSRGHTAWQIRIDVALVRLAIAERQEQTADEQFALIGELTRYLQKTPVEIPGSADLQSIDTGVLYVPERLVEQRMLVSAINLTYQVVIDTQPR